MDSNVPAAAVSATAPRRSRVVPLAVWMLVLSVVLPLLSGWSPARVVGAVNLGFGRALGEFALLLLPSFVLAFSLSGSALGGASRVGAFASPLLGGVMVCPDTAYAAVSAFAGARKLHAALGAYAGFKLLFPAGPLIVATGFALAPTAGLFGWGLLLLAAVSAVGGWWTQRWAPAEPSEDAGSRTIDRRALVPPLLLVGLLAIGTVGPQALAGLPIAEFIVTPKGALAVAALLALGHVPRSAREQVIQSALRRTVLLLFTIGSASALGGVILGLAPAIPIAAARWGPVTGVLALFTCAALLKVLQGSSMATFAAVTAVASPVLAASGLGAVPAVYAVCLGTMVAITPNDSFYWLVRTDALAARGESEALWILSAGSTLQGLAGLVALLGLVGLGWV